MAAPAPNKRNDLINLLLDTDETDLVNVVDGFLEPLRPPTFAVESKGFEIREPGWRGTFSWESATTHLAELGYAFGDVVTSNKNQLRRVIAVDEGSVWITCGVNSNIVRKMSVEAFGHYEKHETAGSEVRRLAAAIPYAGEDGHDIEGMIALLEAKVRDTPRFAPAQISLNFQGTSGLVTLRWDAMTTKLAERGLAFGDVVADGGKRLHRVVAYVEPNLWITSSEEPDKIVGDAEADRFEKYPL